jgi:hypothetical protein
MPTFSTDFVPPDPVTGLTLTADIPSSAMLLEWDATTLGGAFVDYRVYRSTDAGASFELIGVIAIESESAFADYEAPLNVPIVYRVTVSTTDFESDPVEAGSGFNLDEWWLADPTGDVSRTFHLAYVTGWASRSPLERELYTALGRPKRIAVRGERLGEEGTVDIEAYPDNAAALWALLKDAQLHPTEYVLLKSPFGEVYRVTLGDIDRSRLGAGAQAITVPFVQIA